MEDRAFIGRADSQHRWLRSAVILVLGVALSLVAFRLARQIESAAIDADFQNAAADRVAAVRDALRDQLALQRSVATLFETFDEVSLEQFRQFAGPLYPRESALIGISWAPLVPGQERQAFVEARRAEGLAEFQITERDAKGQIVPAGDRDEYVPVTYLEPLARNEAALGFDLLSEANRRTALERARDSGQIRSSSPQQLVQDAQPRDALLAVAPVYRTGLPTETIAQRRQALRGFVTTVNWIDELIKSGIQRLQPGGVDLDFFDTDAGPDAPPIYEYRSRTRGGDQSDLGLSIGFESTLDVGGRSWRVACSPAPAFVSSRRGPLPMVMLGLGLLSTLLALVFFALQERRARQLAESESRLRNMMLNMPVLLYALDTEKRIAVWNHKCEQVTGYLGDEIIGNPDAFKLLNHDHQRTERSFEVLPADRDFQAVPWAIVDREGNERMVEWYNVSNAMPIPGWASWFIGVDVSERQKMQRQLLRKQKLESLGVLAGGVAHDFNNLLTTIMGNASLAQAAMTDDRGARDALDAVIEASERASALTQQMLAYAGEYRINLRRVEIADLVRGMRPMIESSLPQNVNLKLFVADPVGEVEGDPALLQQLVSSLSINASESYGAKPGDVQVSVRPVTVSESARATAEVEAGDYVLIEVSDQGEGMDSETVERIFDPFFSTRFTGRGLGLAAAQGIVRSHNGAILVQSRLGEGTTVSVYLPASGNAVPRPSSKPQPAAPSDEAAATILIADDEAAISQLAGAGLRRDGFRVLMAEDGVEAVEMFRQHADIIDCIVMDVNMPRMSGEEALREIRKIKPDLPVVLTSGYSAVGRSVETGNTWFLQKPYTPGRLAARVREVLENVPRD